jgi:hypothetical protein
MKLWYGYEHLGHPVYMAKATSPSIYIVDKIVVVGGFVVAGRPL